MKEEDQRIAILLATGWTADKPFRNVYDMDVVLYRTKDTPGILLSETPDYLNDLNAMHEAEKCLGWEEKNFYVKHLGEVVTDAYCQVYMATSRQRAKAFLKTLSLWVD